jgi:DNA-binding NarL/FixJ family response regulator
MFFSSELVGKMLQRSSEFMTKNNTLKFEELHERENHIIKLIFEYFFSAEIAERLRLSEQTINTYRKSLLTKTGAKNDVGLIKYADGLKFRFTYQHTNLYSINSLDFLSNVNLLLLINISL